jgi:pSer/pThr/pTyr-binding forkhead associated (FHA) protein
MMDRFLSNRRNAVRSGSDPTGVPLPEHQRRSVLLRPLTNNYMANYVLEILDGDRAGEVLPVGDSIIRIGRKSGNDIVLTDEKTSGVHCEILPEGDRLVLKDLGSTNGTFLDGKRITELVLTPGDIVTIGRTKVAFRAVGEDAVDVDAGEFAMRKLDARIAGKRGSSIGLMVVLLLVLVAGGGWYWWQGQQQSPGVTKGPAVATKPLVVSGNRIGGELASCEADAGWSLRVAGIGFHPASRANTGNGSFGAYIGGEHEGAAGETAVVAKSDDDFAVMQLAEPLDVFAGRTMTVAGHCMTLAGAQIAVRAKLFAANEDVPFRFCSGTALTAYEDGWQRVATTVTVPTGCDRMLVEVVAVLPNKESEAFVDDFAVVEGGDANGLALALKESGQTAFGFGAAVAVRSSESSSPATVLQVLPDQVPATMTRLHQAGYCVLSDLGASLACSESESGLEFAATGVQSLQFVMPADAASGLMVAEQAAFAPGSVQSEFVAQRVLFGTHATRAMLRFDAPIKVRSEVGGGLYRVSCAAANVSLALGFRQERQQAGQLLRSAQADAAEGRPGAALDRLATLFQTVPMDSESLGKAHQLRGELMSGQADRIAQLAKDLEEADFFTTRGGFERVAGGVEQLLQLYGKHNIEDLAGLEALRAKATARLLAIDQATYEVQRTRLTALADAFASAQQTALQKIVSDYITRHLNGK